MTANAAEVQTQPGIIRRRQARYRKLSDVDGRTRSGRRARELAKQFEAALGGADSLTDGQRLAVSRASVMTAIAEDARLRRLSGEPTNLDDLVRLDRVAAQAVRSLGIVTKREPERESLSAYLATLPAEGGQG